jgi:hypothetical protein
MPRTAPNNVTEHRLTLGTYERNALADLARQDEDDFDLQPIIDVTKALALPVASLTSAYLLYLGLINFSTGVDELRNRFGETPFGRYANRFGPNIRRTHPLYRFLTWGFGGENPPIVPELNQEKAESIFNKAVDVISNAIPDVPTPGSTYNAQGGSTNSGGGGGF